MSALKKRRLESEGARIRRLSGMFGEMWAMVCAFTLETDMIAYLEDNDYTDGRVYRWAETADHLRIEWENGWIRRVVVLKGWSEMDRPRSPQLRETLCLRGAGLEHVKEMFCRRMVFHRDNDLPALIRVDGSKEWYRAGVRHRCGDKPAVIDAFGHFWYQYGKIHRDGDKPAVTYSDGTMEWYRDDVLHRDNDLPAVIKADGGKEWYQAGNLHRDGDKPAIDSREVRAWYHHGKRHRENDKPAVINATGQFWYRHGISWRDNDQPTSVLHDGSKRWHRGYCLHRDNDKPAVVNADGSKRWHVNGKYVNSQDSDGSPRYYDERWHRRI